MSEPKSSFHPLLKPKISPGTNPMPAPIGNPEAAIEECVANCDAVLLSACTACPTTLVNVVLIAFSISIHLTSIQPLYDRNPKPATNNPTTTAAIFMTFLIAYPATAPNSNPPPAEKRKSSTGKSEDDASPQYLCCPLHKGFFLGIAGTSRDIH
jgi:hypothetical protein